MRILASGETASSVVSNSFSTIVDALNTCFDLQYKGYQKAWCDINDIYAAWFPTIGPNNTQWENSISDDGEWISEGNKAKAPLGKDKTYTKYRIVFARRDDGLYRFTGVYKTVSSNETGAEYLLRKHKRVSTFIDLDKLDTQPLFEMGAEHIQEAFRDDVKLSETEKEIVAKARIGQSAFRDRLIERYHGCMVCGLSNRRLLVASHIKGWAEAEPWERIDPDNGLLLCSLHDSLFDRHLITFSDSGEIIISDKLSQKDRNLCNISVNTKIMLCEGSRKYMTIHREHFSENEQ